MTWEEFYDKFYDWSPNTQEKKLGAVNKLGDPEEVTEVIVGLAENDNRTAANKLAKRALNSGMKFTVENIWDVLDYIDDYLHEQMALQSLDYYTKKDLEGLEGCLDDRFISKLYEKKGILHD